MNKKIKLKKETFKIGDIVNVGTIINGLNYNLNVKVIGDILESVPRVLETVQVFQPPAPSKPRP